MLDDVAESARGDWVHNSFASGNLKFPLSKSTRAVLLITIALCYRT